MASNASDINGRVKYIDPTNVRFFNKDGEDEISYIPNDNLVFNSLEDYCIAADLEVMIPNRKACGWAMEDGNYKTLHYSTSEGTISFLHGTDGVLTTNFTDINPLMPDDKMHECLGIESISVSFESWLYPTVNIKFVDVRGASVLAPEDKAMLDDNGRGGSLYRALFTYPPPMFKLKIKGFYGKGVTYYLINQDVKLELDASSGNFNINAQFIGLMYRVYTDMPMSFVAISPYLTNGSEYWKEMVEKGVFEFKNRDGSPSPMRPLPEILDMIAKMSQSSRKQSAAAKREEISESTNQRLETIKDLVSSCPLKDWLSNGNRVYIGTTKSKAEIGAEISNYISRIEGYDTAYGTSHMAVFESLSNYGDKEVRHGFLTIGRKYGYENIKAIVYVRDTDGKLVVDTKHSEVKETEVGIVSGSEPFKYVTDMLATCKEDNTYYIYVLSEVNTEGIQTFLRNLPEEGKKVEEEMEKEIEDYKNIENQLVEDALGFSPTIKNMYNLVFAHMDTFIHAFYKNADIIYDKLKTDDVTREIATVLGGGVATDTVSSEKYLPPYTEIFEKREEDGVSKNVSIWPGKIKGGNALEEVDFVLDLLSACRIYQKEVDELLSDSGSTYDIDFMKDAPTARVRHMLPGTLYDIVKKDEIGNPYQWIATQIRSLSDSDFYDAIVGTFTNRIYYYLMGLTERHAESADDFGKLDAINLAKAFEGIENDPRFENFVRQCKDSGKFVDTVLKRVKSESKMWNFGGKRLLSSDNKYVLTDNFIPIGFGDFRDIRNIYAGGSEEMSRDERFIRTSKSEENKETFQVFDSRDYVKAISDAIKSEVGTNYNGILDEKEIDNIFDENGIDTKLEHDEILFQHGIIYKKGEVASADTVVNNWRKDGIADIANKSYKEREDYYVKYPAIMNEKKNKSLFDSKIYTEQTNILSKAYLFLSSIPLKKWKEHDFSGINKDSENGVEQKARLLREGSFYWREYMMSQNGDKDPIIHNGRPIGRNETFMGYNFRVDRVETIKEGYSNYYVTWETPKGSTASRKSVLRRKFEDWVKNEYEKVEYILSNTLYYTDHDFSKGFNSDLLRRKDADAVARNAEQAQEFLLGTFLDVCTIIDYHGDGTNPRRAEVKEGLNGFVKAITDMFGEKKEKGKEETEVTKAVIPEDPFRNDDIRLSTYQTLKLLYDKWLCAPYKGRETWSLSNPNSDFNQFMYLDSYYHNIGDVLIVNISNVERWISYCMPSQATSSDNTVSHYFGKSVFDFLSDIAQDSGGMLMAFPQMIGGQSAQHVAEMFKAFPYNSDWETDSSCFCFMYTYAPSKYVGSDEFDDDGFDLVTEQYDFLSDSGETIPAFGVSYGKQNQAFFKNISLNTETPTVTNASIQAMLNIAAKAGSSERETTAFGQDMYKVRASYAYTCEFDMMGCMMVFPLMYFQLNNIPLWRGAYIIYKVTHQMTAGDMTTHVVGVRINKNALPMVEGLLPTNKDEQPNGEGDGSYDGDNCGPTNSGDNSAVEPSKDTEANPNKKISDRVDFTETNISEEKPIICITPAHGPKTNKKLEYAWSSKLIDGYIIPKLQKLKFSDGTSYAQNIQRCNKGGNHTGNGYSMVETKGFIEKYGSKKVISVVPHWNGCGGRYYSVFDGKAYSGGTIKVRDDSKKLAESLREEVRKMAEKGKAGLYALLPKGAMDGGVKSASSNRGHILSESNTDGAVQLNCACILSENWFADYDEDAGGKSGKWSIQGLWDAITGGRYKIMRGWLESEEGLNAIADAHVEAIRRYINTLNKS